MLGYEDGLSTSYLIFVVRVTMSPIWTVRGKQWEGKSAILKTHESLIHSNYKYSPINDTHVHTSFVLVILNHSAVAMHYTRDKLLTLRIYGKHTNHKLAHDKRTIKIMYQQRKLCVLKAPHPSIIARSRTPEQRALFSLWSERDD